MESHVLEYKCPRAIHAPNNFNLDLLLCSPFDFFFPSPYELSSSPHRGLGQGHIAPHQARTSPKERMSDHCYLCRGTICTSIEAAGAVLVRRTGGSLLQLAEFYHL
jgi:hypothetical protein